MCRLGTDRDPVYTGPNEYLPVQPAVNTPWSHRTALCYGTSLLTRIRANFASVNIGFFLMKGVSCQAFTSQTVQKLATGFRCLHEWA